MRHYGHRLDARAVLPARWIGFVTLVAFTAVPSRTMFPEYGAMKPFIDSVVNAGLGISPNADVVKAKGLIEVGWDVAGPLAWNDPCARQIDINTKREPWSSRRASYHLTQRTGRTGRRREARACQCTVGEQRIA